MPQHKTMPDAERFWTHVAIGDPDACWPWMGSLKSRGYGRFQIGSMKDGSRRPTIAHRYAFFLHNGRWPDGFARHTCDNPSCCNPAHVIDGTPRENSHDMVERGRQAKGIRNGRATITDRDVQIIRVLLSVGLTQREIGQCYGLSGVQIGRIQHRVLWSHVPDMSLGG